MKTLTIFTLIAAVLFSGCALAPHKPVAIKPELSVTESTIGQNQKIWINVSDERPRPTLGTRGISGIGSEISIEGQLSLALRNSLTDGLRRLGFSPIDNRISDARELRVEVRNLDYTVMAGFWTGTLRTECILKGFCVVGETRPYENIYHGEYQETIVFYKSEEDNERYINSAVSQAVNALLADPQMIRWLATGK